MINSKNYIGTNSRGDTHIFQEIDSNGMIRGFNGYCVVETVDGTKGLENVQWTHKETIHGVMYETGDLLAPIIDMPDDIADLYEINTVSCEECGGAHDSEQYGAMSFVVVNECEVYCKQCVKSSDLLVQVNESGDLFKARDVDGIDLNGYEEIDTLFCDSSGFGAPGEMALTKNQALKRMQDLLDSNSGPIYAGISDMGQFQVYVTLYRKVA